MDSHLELQAIRSRLKEILASISTFTTVVVRPPIINSSIDSSDVESSRSDSVRGLRNLRDAVKRDLDVLEKFLANPDNTHAPALSTNAPYLIAVWNEVLHAKQPVIGIWNTYSESGSSLHPRRRRGAPKEAGVKVDVVADGGRQWIRVNTTKNSRMLAEFRELDSYLTESESDEDESERNPPTLAQTELDNSVLRMGRSLLEAAKHNPLGDKVGIPRVIMRLTRLDPSPADEKEHDLRISRTIQALEELGVSVELGEQTFEGHSQKEEKAHVTRLEPTTCINLDLSILVALVSDLTHATLPSSPEDAESRFTPGATYLQWKKKRIDGLKSGAHTTADNLSDDDARYHARPSRALVQQAIQEMHRSLLDEISERTAVHQHVEFWTTLEARNRCLQIVGKIGGTNEKRRAEALLSTDVDLDIRQAEEAFWRDSRYHSSRIPLLPIRMLPAGLPDEKVNPPLRSQDNKPLSPFFRSLAGICRDILAQETTTYSRSNDPSESPLDNLRNDDDDPETGEIPRATVMKANPRLTVHTVQSTLWGAVRGWTTLTANKTSVKALLRDIKSVKNKSWDQSDDSDLVDTLETLNIKDSEDPAEIAALWMVDPRSLAEGMRADFEP
ncbi:hypothetical protein BDW22DRAFT_1431027 [Trametopsis cervina]|nr:hypothetical protein BDW22DRAFT_1431027 [Trametopsis cervina]